MQDFSFAPDGVRARLLDRRMHVELGHSFRYLQSRLLDESPAASAALGNLATYLEGGAAVSPAVFGRYYELVETLLAGDTLSAAEISAEAANIPLWSGGLDTVVLGDVSLGAANALYIRKMNEDERIDIGFGEPSAEQAQSFALRLTEGLDLLDREIPELAAEFRGIIRQIVIAGGEPDKELQFDGGSHFQLWGALFLNAAFHPDDIAVAEVLAHESAHSLLFSFCVDEALVENDDEELFSSPLRTDKRPMNGIYHATFVSARMHWAMSRLAASARLNSDQRSRARAAAEADRVNFESGYSVLADFGQLTQTGASLMASAHDYMKSVAQPITA